MPRREAGKTTASRVKSLFLHVQRHHGRAEADAFLVRTRLDRDFLDDETRPLPSERWHAALVAFASRWGREEIARIVPATVDPEILGAWTRVLRGADEVCIAYRNLDQHGGDEALTDRWKTLESGRGIWRGTVEVGAEHERDGLCALARTAELAAVPLLFGLAAARVEHAMETSEGRERLALTVRWREPGNGPVAAGAAASVAGAGAVISAVGTEPAVLLGSVIALVAGTSAGVAVAQSARRRSQTRSQLTRIMALERGATLREARERSTLAFGEGAVIAGQYKLGKKLGAGASGAIYEANRLSDGQIVAIKLLRAAVAHDNLAADRLRREASALGLAWHPNVVELFDDGQLPDGTSYLVMERLHGEPLSARLKARALLPPAELLPIAIQVCDALGAVHAAGVIHRDLKPSNIFLARGLGASPDDVADHVPSSPKLAGGERIKVLDFGVARVEWAETRLTNMGVPLGTPGYMAPEQRGGLEIDPRADLFSLGAVLYECLTGEAPPVETDELWSTTPAPDSTPSGVQRALGTISKPWRKVIDRALAEHPRDRFADARAFKRALMELGAAEGDARHG